VTGVFVLGFDAIGFCKEGFDSAADFLLFFDRWRWYSDFLKIALRNLPNSR
jgi:hypothetical protein